MGLLLVGKQNYPFFCGWKFAELKMIIQSYRTAVFAELAGHASANPMNIHGMLLATLGAPALNGRPGYMVEGIDVIIHFLRL